MSTQMSRPDLACHDQAVRKPFEEVVAELREILGPRLVAYIGRVGETRAVRQWADGSRSVSETTERRLRLAFEVAKCIAMAEGKRTTQVWFQGLNPLLNDTSPARVLREGDVDIDGPAVIAAERVFLTG
jgi:hypothetical protein